MNLDIYMSRFVELGCVTFSIRLVFYRTEGVHPKDTYNESHGYKWSRGGCSICQNKSYQILTMPKILVGFLMYFLKFGNKLNVVTFLAGVCLKMASN